MAKCLPLTLLRPSCVSKLSAALSMAFFGGGLWKNYGDYLRHKSAKLHSQLRLSVSASRKEEGGHSSSGKNETSDSSVFPFRNEEAALCFIERYIRSPSGLFSSLVFFIDGPQRLRIAEESEGGATTPRENLQASFNGRADLSFALCSATNAKSFLLDDELLRRLILAHGGLISIGMGSGVTHVLTENVALGNQRWKLFR